MPNFSSKKLNKITKKFTLLFFFFTFQIKLWGNPRCTRNGRMSLARGGGARECGSYANGSSGQIIRFWICYSHNMADRDDNSEHDSNEDASADEHMADEDVNPNESAVRAAAPRAVANNDVHANLRSSVIVALVAAAVFSFALSGFGFGSYGISKGSYAATLMSLTTRLGFGQSLVSHLQSCGVKWIATGFTIFITVAVCMFLFRTYGRGGARGGRDESHIRNLRD
ncbi:hypothetical protein Btru_075026 [Bulinus truncatus]|nr:hypothetical protein Btru_075026 [Bulinus truncatus]